MIARLLVAFALLLQVAPGAEFANGGFESGNEGWRFWTRETGAGRFELDTTTVQQGAQAGKITHTGTNDWSLEPDLKLQVKPGELYEIRAQVRVVGEGRVVVCGSIADASGKVVDWSRGDRTSPQDAGWHKVVARVLIPEGVSVLQPRILGYGPGVTGIDAFEVEKTKTFTRPRDMPGALSLTNECLEVTFDTGNSTFTVVDRRTKRVWKQAPTLSDVVLTRAEVVGNGLQLSFIHGPSGLDLRCEVRFDSRSPEILVELSGNGELLTPVRFPAPFQGMKGDYLVIPMNEGISYPVDDTSAPLHRLIAYGGHGICMAFWGVTDGESGQMCIFETPDDAAIQMARVDSKLVIAPEWEPQLKSFGYPRKLRYVFLDRGGHVAMAKRYRDTARELGLIRTLEQKRQENPNVDLLVGAVNVWCWDRDAVGIVKEMKASGIERILWSNRQNPEALRALNELRVLTSRYDIYQDVMDPAQFSKLQWVHPDWTTAAWPKEIIMGADGKWIKGWGVEAKDGSMISCGVICDRRALSYARERTTAELETHPYKCRFIDTTTAAPWHECYDPNHPMTRTESKQAKMALLKLFSSDMKLVVGCETGHDASVPYLHYFEGMLSLGPLRVPDSGRRMSVIWTNVPEPVAKYQLGHAYRLPLWELVYHDCAVAQWYWGDYNNKLPSLWAKRDLFNILYGTGPMFMFSRDLWTAEKERFARSYRAVCTEVRKVGYAEMTGHRFLTSDRSVQQTTFSSGHTVTVNFADSEVRLPGSSGVVLKPMSYIVRP